MTITTKLRTEAAQTHTKLIAATTNAYNAIAPMTTNPLTPAEQKILLIESKKFRHQDNKERRIYEAGFTPIAYYQKLNAMLDDERIYNAAPELITALRNKRAEQ